MKLTVEYCWMCFSKCIPNIIDFHILRTRIFLSDANESKIYRPVLAWDVLRFAILWQICCARCPFIFSMSSACLKCATERGMTQFIEGWLGGALRSNPMRNVVKNGLKDFSVQEFASFWCFKSVFCNTSLHSPTWKLAPTLTHNVVYHVWYRYWYFVYSSTVIDWLLPL